MLAHKESSAETKKKSNTYAESSQSMASLSLEKLILLPCVQNILQFTHLGEHFGQTLKFDPSPFALTPLRTFFSWPNFQPTKVS